MSTTTAAIKALAFAEERERVRRGFSGIRFGLAELG
jgi:hypothetical protein